MVERCPLHPLTQAIALSLPASAAVLTAPAAQADFVQIPLRETLSIDTGTSGITASASKFQPISSARKSGAAAPIAAFSPAQGVLMASGLGLFGWAARGISDSS